MDGKARSPLLLPVFLFTYLWTGEIGSTMVFHQHPASPTAIDLFAELDLHPYRTIVQFADIAGVVVPVGIQHRGGNNLTAGCSTDKQSAFVGDLDDLK